MTKPNPNEGALARWRKHPACDRIMAIDQFASVHGFEEYTGEDIPTFLETELNTAYALGRSDEAEHCNRCTESARKEAIQEMGQTVGHHSSMAGFQVVQLASAEEWKAAAEKLRKEGRMSAIEDAIACVPPEPKDSDYVRNHVLPSHTRTTLTNEYRRGFKNCREATLKALTSLQSKDAAITAIKE